MPASRYQDARGGAKTGGAPAAGGRLSSAAVAALLIAVGLAVLGGTLGLGFTNYDDAEYVLDNPPVREGLSAESVRWAFTTTHQANWHPLTWLSLMLDAELGGLRADVYHRTNLILHLAATLLLFALLERTTGRRWPAAWVAALFAVHPLHVESVAWIAERKDVLSTALGFATLYAWTRRVERPAGWRYGLAVALFALGLLAKPMLVTLPAILLLLDVWPLGRLPLDGGFAARVGPLLREKIPFFVLAAGSAGVTLFAQHSGGAMGTLESYPLPSRLANAVVSYGWYLQAAVWPAGLGAFYPHPGSRIEYAPLALSSALLVVLSWGAWRMRSSRPHLLFGWLWYVGTLLPVIGVIQVGLQSRADRYSYLPLVGVFVAVAWALAELAGPAGGTRRRAIVVAAVAATAALGGAARVQVRYWQDGITLFERALAVTTENAVARNNLGSAYYRRNGPGDLERSVEHYAEAVRINPRYAVAFNNLAGSLMRLGRTDEAIARWRDAIRVKPAYVAARCNLAGALVRTERFDEGMTQCHEALRLDPDASCAHYNLGLALLKRGDLVEAERHFAEAVRAEPAYVDSRLNLGVTRARLGRMPEAIEQFREVLRLDPGNEMARFNLQKALSR